MPRWSILVCATVFIALTSVAQAPAGAPSGANGVCNDGTYSTATSKRGACAGHKGVKTWFASPGPVNQAPSAPTTGSAPSTAPSPTSAPAQAQKQGSGGGNGQVWVNTASNVYHCQGDRSYGTTKAGQYMSEADAKSKGARPAYGKICTK